MYIVRKYVIYERKGHIAYGTINRPEVMNALHNVHAPSFIVL